LSEIKAGNRADIKVSTARNRVSIAAVIFRGLTGPPSKVIAHVNAAGLVRMRIAKGQTSAAIGARGRSHAGAVGDVLLLPGLPV